MAPHAQAGPPAADGPPGLGHVLLTGATGFLGQAMLERLIVDHPATRVTVLIRPRGEVTAAERLAGLARKPVFRALRDRIGLAGVQAELAARVQCLECELGTDLPPLPEDLTTVLHCASTVSFDPPVDEAFRINVRGARDLYDRLADCPGRPHIVHVSTAYVSAVHKGTIAERSLDHDADWRVELDSALAAREEAERSSRSPAQLRRLLSEARAQHHKAGAGAVAEAVEEARRGWVRDRLVEAGLLRGQSLGWTDVYTFTKALGERVAEEYTSEAGLRTSILRPTIVQAALRLPYPGWFESYKMMDPVILAYGRGEIPEFPVSPDSVIDIIPVDHVTAAALAVAAAPPKPGQPAYFHVGTGARNPLTQRDLHLHVAAYFRDHPLPNGARGHVKVPTWRFTGAASVERAMRAGERAVSAADRVLLRLPASARTRDWLERTRADAQVASSLRRLLDLYGGYGGVEAVYDDANTAALSAVRPTDTAGSPEHGTVAGEPEGGFDTAGIDWAYYLREVYCPSITSAARRAAGPRRRPARSAEAAGAHIALGSGRGEAGRDGDDGSGIAALFDLEGTILGSNLVEVFLWTRLSARPRSSWPAELLSFATSVPGYLQAERRDRADFVRMFMRRYAGCSEAELRAMVRNRIGDALLHRAFPEAVRTIRAHRAAGHRTVLITGTADLLIAPLLPLFDTVAASRLQVKDGTLTGFLERPPIVGEARAAWARAWADKTGIDLKRSYAYGDSISDRALLDLVGIPVAVNPDPRLHRYAARRAWRVEQWGTHSGGRIDAAVTALSAATAGTR